MQKIIVTKDAIEFEGNVGRIEGLSLIISGTLFILSDIKKLDKNAGIAAAKTVIDAINEEIINK